MLCGDVDSCVYDAENDKDSDVVCGHIDSCAYDAEHDADSDVVCGDVDSCEYDAENDADSDVICGDVDSCSYDAENDMDSDVVCGHVDSCAYDTENDADSDGVCGDLDSCTYDAENDADSDSSCDDGDSCRRDAQNDADSDSTCGDADSCPADAENDADSDFVCKELDFCAHDAGNDADSDTACGDVDSCANDSNNDEDGDSICADVDSCARDAENDSDSDTTCGDTDSCRFDADNDVDSDSVCGHADSCPFDSLNDGDSDGVCGGVDSCPFTSSTDAADSDGFCDDLFSGDVVDPVQAAAAAVALLRNGTSRATPDELAAMLDVLSLLVDSLDYSVTGIGGGLFNYSGVAVFVIDAVDAFASAVVGWWAAGGGNTSSIGIGGVGIIAGRAAMLQQMTGILDSACTVLTQSGSKAAEFETPTFRMTCTSGAAAAVDPGALVATTDDASVSTAGASAEGVTGLSVTVWTTTSGQLELVAALVVEPGGNSSSATPLPTLSNIVSVTAFGASGGVDASSVGAGFTVGILLGDSSVDTEEEEGEAVGIQQRLSCRFYEHVNATWSARGVCVCNDLSSAVAVAASSVFLFFVRAFVRRSQFFKVRCAARAWSSSTSTRLLGAESIYNPAKP